MLDSSSDPKHAASPSKMEAGETYNLGSQNTIQAATNRLGDPAPLAMGGFATTIITVSFAMMSFRDVTVPTLNVGNLLFVASVGLLISAQWEMARGNTFSYTVLSAYGLFYGSYGFILLPTLDIAQPYGGSVTPQYHNALGFYLLMWGVFNTFFLITSTAYNLVYALLFLGLELCLLLDGASYFVLAAGNEAMHSHMQQASGAFGFIAGLMGYYACAHYMCEEALPFRIPMGQLKKRGKSRTA